MNASDAVTELRREVADAAERVRVVAETECEDCREPALLCRCGGGDA